MSVLGNPIRVLLNNAVAIEALPGWGKTTDIIENVKEGDCVVAMTSEIIQSLKNRITVCQVMSVEKLIATNVKNINTLFVDEASMINISTILPLLARNIKQLKVYGDSS